jgi:hypothetical protein
MGTLSRKKAGLVQKGIIAALLILSAYLAYLIIHAYFLQ